MKLLTIILAVMATGASAKANTIECFQQNTLFSMSIDLLEELPSDFWEHKYSSKVHSLSGPRLPEHIYDAIVTQRPISTRIYWGHSYSTTLPDGTEILLDDVNGPEEWAKFTGVITTPSGAEIHLTCQ